MKAMCCTCKGTRIHAVVRALVTVERFDLHPTRGTVEDFDPSSMLGDWQESVDPKDWEFYCLDCEDYREVLAVDL